MYLLKIFDRKGLELNEGDLVKISNSGRFNFFAEVKYLEKEKSIAPFCTFSFHSFEKIDSIPVDAIKSTEDRYNVWYVYDGEEDKEKEAHESYLTDWRTCEHNIDKRMFRIEQNAQECGATK